jgi:hypothetical protein
MVDSQISEVDGIPAPVSLAQQWVRICRHRKVRKQRDLFPW